jgi:hypothetical protein
MIMTSSATKSRWDRISEAAHKVHQPLDGKAKSSKYKARKS